MYLSASDINKIRQLMQNKPVHKVYLFGSYARGQATHNSDIDLLVEFDYAELNKEYDYFDIKFEVEDYLQKKVDLVSAKMLPASKIAPFVEHDKILIYENTY
jgi:predicted nucleotidyltransferase